MTSLTNKIWLTSENTTKPSSPLNQELSLAPPRGQVGNYDNIYINTTEDSHGYIYATGISQESENIANAIITKLNRRGRPIWDRVISSGGLANPTRDAGLFVLTDSHDDPYVVGFTTGDLIGNSTSTSQKVFVVKFDKNGTELWRREYGSLDETDIHTPVRAYIKNNQLFIAVQAIVSMNELYEFKSSDEIQVHTLKFDENFENISYILRLSSDGSDLTIQQISITINCISVYLLSVTDMQFDIKRPCDRSAVDDTDHFYVSGTYNNKRGSYIFVNRYKQSDISLQNTFFYEIQSGGRDSQNNVYILLGPKTLYVIFTNSEGDDFDTPLIQYISVARLRKRDLGVIGDITYLSLKPRDSTAQMFVLPTILKAFVLDDHENFYMIHRDLIENNEEGIYLSKCNTDGDIVFSTRLPDDPKAVRYAGLLYRCGYIHVVSTVLQDGSRSIAKSRKIVLQGGNTLLRTYYADCQKQGQQVGQTITISRNIQPNLSMGTYLDLLCNGDILAVGYFISEEDGICIDPFFARFDFILDDCCDKKCCYKDNCVKKTNTDCDNISDVSSDSSVECHETTLLERFIHFIVRIISMIILPTYLIRYISHILRCFFNSILGRHIQKIHKNPKVKNLPQLPDVRRHLEKYDFRLVDKNDDNDEDSTSHKGKNRVRRTKPFRERRDSTYSKHCSRDSDVSSRNMADIEM